MSDYDIVIKLDPGQPVLSTKQIAAALAELEKQGKKTKEEVEGVGKGVQSLNFKQAAAAGAQAWGILSQKFELGNTLLGKAIDSTVKFTALGAQIAGPWGAGLGAVAGLLLEVTDDITGLRSEVTKLAEESKKLADQHLKNMGGRLGELAREAKANYEALEKMNAGLYALPGALANTFDAFDKQRDVIKRAREEIERYNANAAALRAVGIMNKATGQSGFFGSTLGGGAGAAVNAGLFQTLPTSGEDNTPEQTWESVFGSRGRFSLPPSPEPWSIAGSGYSPFGDDIRRAGMQADVLTFEEIGSQIDAADESLRMWHEDLDVSQRKMDELLDRARPLEDFFVQLATTGEASFSRMIDAMLADLSRLATHQLFKSIAGALFSTGPAPVGAVGLAGLGGGLGGALGGFASGGVIGPRGSGAADTETAMFRVAPRETIRIHTPEQEAAYARGGGGPAVNIVNTPVDDRALLQALSGPSGAQTVMNVVRSNRRAIKALLDG